MGKKVTVRLFTSIIVKRKTKLKTAIPRFIILPKHVKDYYQLEPNDLVKMIVIRFGIIPEEITLEGVKPKEIFDPPFSYVQVLVGKVVKKRSRYYIKFPLSIALAWDLRDGEIVRVGIIKKLKRLIYTT